MGDEVCDARKYSELYAVGFKQHVASGPVIFVSVAGVGCFVLTHYFDRD